MRKSFQLALLCVVLVFSCLFTSCKTPTLKSEDGGFRNPQTDVTYYPASPNYFCKPSGGEAYARIKSPAGGADILLYEIEGVDPERYLASNDYRVYCASGAELPELYDLPCVRVGIYDTQVSSNDGNITNADEILALKELHKKGAHVALNTIGIYVENSNWFDLRFMSDGAYKGIYFELKYGVFDADVIVTELVSKDGNGYMIDLYPGVPYELGQEMYEGSLREVARYNFGREILCDVSTGNCYRIENSLLPYVTPEAE